MFCTWINHPGIISGTYCFIINSCVLFSQEFKPSHVFLVIVQNPQVTSKCHVSHRSFFSYNLDDAAVFCFISSVDVTKAPLDVFRLLFHLCVSPLNPFITSFQISESHSKYKDWRFGHQVHSSESMQSCEYTVHHLCTGALCASYIVSPPIISAANHPGGPHRHWENHQKEQWYYAKHKERAVQFISVSSSSALCRLKYVGANIISIFHYADEVRSSKTILSHQLTRWLHCVNLDFVGC